MYYEEKIIDGVLCWRNQPDGEWRAFSATELSGRVRIAEKRYNELIYAVESKRNPSTRHETALAYIQAAESRLGANIGPAETSATRADANSE